MTHPSRPDIIGATNRPERMPFETKAEFDSVRDRYEQDTTFHATVDMLWVMLENGRLTTQNIAQAATLAAQLYLERHNAPVMIVLRNMTDEP